MLPKELKKRINAELMDSKLYYKMADVAPNEEYRIILTEMSQDEQNHANILTKLFVKMTGKGYIPVIDEPVLVNSFYDMMRKRVLDENYDFREYRRMAREEENENIKKEFEKFADDEHNHAIRLLYMLTGY